MQDEVEKYKLQIHYEDKLQQVELTICSLTKLMRAGIKLPVPNCKDVNLTDNCNLIVFMCLNITKLII